MSSKSGAAAVGGAGASSAAASTASAVTKPNYGAVVGGKLKLKKPGPATGGSGSGASAPAVAGVKRPASAMTSTTSAPAPSGEPPAKVVVALSDAPIETIKASADGLTPAQRAHEEAIRQRERELARKAVKKSHREKVDDLNVLLSKMPEHHDIPKISYAGIG